jgi:hypothetical protein
MNIGQRSPNQNNAGSTQFLNFSDALNHLRWGDRIARRNWRKGQSVVVDYRHPDATIRVENKGYGYTDNYLSGADILAEDWYVL